MPVLIVENLYKSFENNEVIKDISLQVEKGEVLAVIGPSGSGKSTLLRCITQLEKVDSGRISVCGEEMTIQNKNGKTLYSSEEILRKIRLCTGMVFQSYNLFPHFNVLRNITEAMRVVLKMDNEDAEIKAMELLGKMGLEDKAEAYPCELSGGQQQRVSIARALALSPEILFFDEPTSALDPELTGEILKVIRDLAKEKMTMVIVTHEMAFARDVADHVIFMDKGMIVEQGTPQEVFSGAQNERTKAFLNRYYQE